MDEVKSTPPLPGASYYAFLIQRKQDKEAWATIFLDRERAENYPDRVSLVTEVRLVRKNG